MEMEEITKHDFFKIKFIPILFYQKLHEQWYVKDLVERTAVVRSLLNFQKHFQGGNVNFWKDKIYCCRKSNFAICDEIGGRHRFWWDQRNFVTYISCDYNLCWIKKLSLIRTILTISLLLYEIEQGELACWIPNHLKHMNSH